MDPKQPQAQQTAVSQQPPAAAAARPTEPPSGGINLIPQLTEEEIKSGVYRRKANLGAMAVLALIGIIILGIIGAQLFLKLRADSITNQITEAKERITDNREIEIKAIAVKSKIDKVRDLLKNSVPNSTLLEEVDKAAATSPAVSVTTVSSTESGEVFVEGTTNNSDIFKQWLANLTSEAAKENFSQVSLVTLSGNPGENYKFAVKFTFTKKGVAQNAE